MYFVDGHPPSTRFPSLNWVCNPPPPPPPTYLAARKNQNCMFYGLLTVTILFFFVQKRFLYSFFYHFFYKEFLTDFPSVGPYLITACCFNLWGPFRYNIFLILVCIFALCTAGVIIVGGGWRGGGTLPFSPPTYREGLAVYYQWSLDPSCLISFYNFA